MTQEFATKKALISSDPFTWNLESSYDGQAGSEEHIAIRNEQSEYLHNVPIEEVHILHIHLDPGGVVATLMGLPVMWLSNEFYKLIEGTPIALYREFEGKRVREVTYYSDKQAVEFVYSAKHPLDPQPPNTVHSAVDHLHLIDSLKDKIADRWDEETEIFAKNYQENSF
jgi:hypothetical protein